MGMSSSALRLDTHRWNGLLLAALSAFLLWAWVSGRVSRCVAPRYVWLTPFGAAFVLAMGLAALFKQVGDCAHESGHAHGAGECEHDAESTPSTCRGHADHDCSAAHASPDSGAAAAHTHDCCSGSRWPWLHRLVIAAPFIFAAVADPVRLSAEGVRKRRIPQGAVSRRAGSVHDPALGQALDWIFGAPFEVAGTAAGADGTAAGAGGGLELGTATIKDVYGWIQEGRGAELDGKFIALTGRAEAALSGDTRFELSRVVVVCCIADAMSVALEVVPCPGSSIVPGQWVRVSGVLRLHGVGDLAVPVLHASLPAERVPEPEYPYL